MKVLYFYCIALVFIIKFYSSVIKDLIIFVMSSKPTKAHFNMNGLNWKTLTTAGGDCKISCTDKNFQTLCRDMDVKCDSDFEIPEHTQHIDLKYFSPSFHIFKKKVYIPERTETIPPRGCKEEDISDECLEGDHTGRKLRTARTLSDGTRMGCCTDCLPYEEGSGIFHEARFEPIQYLIQPKQI